MEAKDKIYIKDLELIAYHGVLEEEKQLGQKFLISLEISTSLRKAGLTDDLNNTISYTEICDVVEKLFLSKKNDLIEKCGEEIAELILKKNDSIQKVKVTIKKPWAPIRKILDYAAIEVIRGRHKVFISFGSNLGDKKQNIEAALDKIGRLTNTKIIKTSSIIETEPFGNVEQDIFLNGVVEIETFMEADELLESLLSIETELGRVREVRWGPRIIDLDILLYDSDIINKENLTIPHPWMNERMFVLGPLLEIAPNVIEPLSSKRIRQLKEELEDKIKKSGIK